mmetsp:Transcript_3210/g.3131  ORF Transcript_3210/g.3131 Transcript_3210/m.3131 type:complete len:87 (-) Transcript_3210:732-992(-)
MFPGGTGNDGEPPKSNQKKPPTYSKAKSNKENVDTNMRNEAISQNQFTLGRVPPKKNSHTPDREKGLREKMACNDGKALEVKRGKS